MLDQIIAISMLCIQPMAIDGDTIKCENTEARFRLFGIQAPEMGTPGAVSSKYALKRVMGDKVRCRATGGRSYGRIVARCYNLDGEDIGELQIRRGHASEWCEYSKGIYGGC